MCHMYMTDFAYDGQIFLVPSSPSYPSLPVLGDCIAFCLFIAVDVPVPGEPEYADFVHGPYWDHRDSFFKGSMSWHEPAGKLEK